MSRTSVCSCFIAAAFALSGLPAQAQAVISTRSGLVHYFEGAVTVAGQPLEAHLGKFAVIPQGAELRTAKGKAEVLLTPGVFLRVGENSGIRMLANSLSDTRVELLAGSAIVDSTELDAGTSVTMIVKGWNIRQPEKGAYRIDCEPPRLQVTEGAVEASSGGGAPTQVAQGRELPLTPGVADTQAAGESRDGLSEWADGRTEAVSADNAVAADIQDPANLPGLDRSMDGFTYFPMLPFSSLGSNSYGALTPYPYGVSGLSIQPGFYSLYLPGYLRKPLGLPLPIVRSPAGLRTFYPPARTGYTGTGYTGTGYTGGYRGVPPPRTPVVRPLPAPARPGGIHVIHR